MHDKQDLLKSHVEWLRGDHEGRNPWLADAIEDLQRALETGVKAPSYAPSDRDVVTSDRHGFAYRARRDIRGGWSLFGSRRVPIFTDADLVGWIALPRAVRDYDYDNGGPS